MSTTEPSEQELEEWEREAGSAPMAGEQCIFGEEANRLLALISLVRTLRATVAKLTEERDAALTKATQHEDDWRKSKHEFGTAMSQLRAQLAERDGQIAALRKADATGCDCGEPGLPDVPGHLAQCARW